MLNSLKNSARCKHQHNFELPHWCDMHYINLLFIRLIWMLKITLSGERNSFSFRGHPSFIGSTLNQKDFSLAPFQQRFGVPAQVITISFRLFTFFCTCYPSSSAHFQQVKTLMLAAVSSNTNLKKIILCFFLWFNNLKKEGVGIRKTSHLW